MKFIFQAGGALPADHPTYVERPTADRKAFRSALRGEYLAVIAPRQVGKTSLLKRLARRLEKEENWRCVYVDLSRLIGFTSASWYTTFGTILAKDLTPNHIPSLKNQIEMGSYLTDQALPYSDVKPNIALLLDEVEGVLKVRDELGESFSSAFFETLRSLFNVRDKFSGKLVVVLAGATSDESLVEDQMLSPFNIAKAIDLDDFTLTEVKTLVNHFMDLDLSVDDPICQVIYDWTNGHPYLTQCICRELEELVVDGSITTLTIDHVLRVIQRTFLTPPFLLETNLKHVGNMLKNISAPSKALWRGLLAGEEFLVGAKPDVYQELYLAGAVKSREGQIVIRNRIYKEVFSKGMNAEKIRSNIPAEKEILPQWPDFVQAPPSNKDDNSGGNVHGIPGELYRRLCQALRQCGPFENDSQLRDVFAHGSLAPWLSRLPEAVNMDDRINSTIRFLMEKRHSEKQANGLVLLLEVLRDRIDTLDDCHVRLAHLVPELNEVLS